MQIVENELIHKVSLWVKGRFSSEDTHLLCYHHLEHTQEVVAAAKEIAQAYDLEQEDHLALVIAAWFHDTGCWGQSLKQHESTGAMLAASFLEKEGMPNSLIEKVKGCILATRMPQSPTSLIEQIIGDADLYHLGSEQYYEKSLLLRKELTKLKLLDMDLLSWLKSNLVFLGNHEYHTDYCKQKLTSGKQKNMANLVQKIELLEKEGKKKKKAKVKKNSRPERGIETLFRTTSKNHLELSAIADNKANIMISVNSIILTIIVSVLLRKLEEFPNFIIPTVLMLTTSLVTMIFAILATRPNVTSGRVTKEDIDKKESNLLYFGNFHQMELSEYTYGVNQMMNDADFLYGSMIKDIYFLGKVLGKKYTLLRKSYNVFMYGFILSILAFAIAAIFFPVDTY